MGLVSRSRPSVLWMKSIPACLNIWSAPTYTTSIIIASRGSSSISRLRSIALFLLFFMLVLWHPAREKRKKKKKIRLTCTLDTCSMEKIAFTERKEKPRVSSFFRLREFATIATRYIDFVLASAGEKENWRERSRFRSRRMSSTNGIGRWRERERFERIHERLSSEPFIPFRACHGEERKKKRGKWSTIHQEYFDARWKTSLVRSTAFALVGRIEGMARIQEDLVLYTFGVYLEI